MCECGVGGAGGGIYVHGTHLHPVVPHLQKGGVCVWRGAHTIRCKHAAGCPPWGEQNRTELCCAVL